MIQTEAEIEKGKGILNIKRMDEKESMKEQQKKKVRQGSLPLKHQQLPRSHIFGVKGEWRMGLPLYDSLSLGTLCFGSTPLPSCTAPHSSTTIPNR